jgi:hypothetical protein
MSPVWMFEDTKELDAISERNLANRRFSALAAAIREHEASTRRKISGTRTVDATLYRRLRQICGEPADAERVA